MTRRPRPSKPRPPRRSRLLNARHASVRGAAAWGRRPAKVGKDYDDTQERDPHRRRGRDRGPGAGGRDGRAAGDACSRRRPGRSDQGARPTGRLAAAPARGVRQLPQAFGQGTHRCAQLRPGRSAGRPAAGARQPGEGSRRRRASRRGQGAAGSAHDPRPVRGSADPRRSGRGARSGHRVRPSCARRHTHQPSRRRGGRGHRRAGARLPAGSAGAASRARSGVGGSLRDAGVG